MSMSLELGSTELDPALQMCLTRAEQRGRDPQPGPAGSAVPKAAQDPFGHRALLALGQFNVHWDAQVLLNRAAFQQVR